VSAVKDQGHCGSCWAFASTATIESYVALSTGMLFDLSTEQIAMCAPNPDACGGTGKCEGSTAELAFEYLTGAKGIYEEYQYPYISYYGESRDIRSVGRLISRSCNAYRKPALTVYIPSSLLGSKCLPYFLAHTVSRVPCRLPILYPCRHGLRVRPARCGRHHPRGSHRRLHQAGQQRLQLPDESHRHPRPPGDQRRCLHVARV
jgi:hypothetical protein